MTPQKATPRLPKKARVLVLDDQRFDRHRLARLCSGLDMKCDITNAKTLADFAGVIDAQIFDLVLLDYGLPDGTGFDALSMVRLSPGNCNAALIMVSGQDEKSLAQDALKAGCSDYITKDDLSATSFLHAVNNAMQKSVLTTQVQVQISRSSETEAVLERFASQCAQDIKPMVSRMMRQLRDLRAAQKTPETQPENPFTDVEHSCMLLWDFLVELESFQAKEEKIIPSQILKQGDIKSRKPPSPFARLSGYAS